MSRDPLRRRTSHPAAYAALVLLAVALWGAGLAGLAHMKPV